MPEGDFWVLVMLYLIWVLVICVCSRTVYTKGYVHFSVYTVDDVSSKGKKKVFSR